MKKIYFSIIAMFFVLTSGLAQDTKSPPPEDRQVLFGEQHLHSEWSSDAFTLGVRQTPEDAYKYAMGEEITLSTSGKRLRNRRLMILLV